MGKTRKKITRAMKIAQAQITKQEAPPNSQEALNKRQKDIKKVCNLYIQLDLLQKSYHTGREDEEEAAALDDAFCRCDSKIEGYPDDIKNEAYSLYLSLQDKGNN